MKRLRLLFAPLFGMLAACAAPADAPPSSSEDAITGTLGDALQRSRACATKSAYEMAGIADVVFVDRATYLGHASWTQATLTPNTKRIALFTFGQERVWIVEDDLGGPRSSQGFYRFDDGARIALVNYADSSKEGEWTVGDGQALECSSPSPALEGGAVVVSQLLMRVANPGGGALHDYVELFNRTAAPTSLEGLSLQTTQTEGGAPNEGLLTVVLPLHGKIEAHAYFLVAVGAPTPEGSGEFATPDQLGESFLLSRMSGKVALAKTTKPARCGGGSCDMTQFLDFVGYGASSDAEGQSAPTFPAGALARKLAGCTDTNINAADFNVGVATIGRNTTTSAQACDAR